MRRVFKALGVVTATIDLGIAGKVALWGGCNLNCVKACS